MHVPVSLSMGGFVSSSNTRVLVVRESKRVYIAERGDKGRRENKKRKQKNQESEKPTFLWYEKRTQREENRGREKRKGKAETEK